jgi:hypothetical protein
MAWRVELCGAKSLRFAGAYFQDRTSERRNSGIIIFDGKKR